VLSGIGRGQILLAVRACDPDAMRASLKSRGAWACVKPMPNRENIPPFSRFLYRHRHKVECFFGKIKHFRTIATRNEKHTENYLALINLAAISIWMRN